MKGISALGRATALILAWALMMTGPAFGQAGIIPLGTLGGILVTPTAINNSGVVVGFSDLADGQTQHAFIFSGGAQGTIRDLGTLGGTNSYAFGIDDSGNIVGISDLESGDASKAFLIAGGGGMSALDTIYQSLLVPQAGDTGFDDLDPLSLFTYGTNLSSGAIAISPTGQIGSSADYITDEIGVQVEPDYLLEGQTLNPINGPTTESFSEVHAVNASGEFVGESHLENDVTHAFLCSNGSKQDLGALGSNGNSSYAYGINSSGDIVGESVVDSGATHAFFYDGSMHDLGTLNDVAGNSTAAGINSSGMVVGTTVSNGFFGLSAFMYTQANGMKTLDSLYPSLLVSFGSGQVGFVSLTTATAINDSGEITGTGIYYDGTTLVDRAYLLIPGVRNGSVQVTIEPQGARDAGAQWQLDGTGELHSSGDVVDNIPAGSHTITFTDVDGFATPPPQAIDVVANETTPATGTYTEQSGSLQVTITPQDAIDHGAQWQLDGAGPLHNSGDIVPDIPTGSHTVTFTDVDGYTTPDPQTVTIMADQTAQAEGDYIEQTGSLQVTLLPDAVNGLGAQWQVDGVFYHSGDIASNLKVGAHTVTFTDVANYTTPASFAVTIVEDVTTPATGTYVLIPPATGSLHVLLFTPDAVAAGAQWQVDSMGWQNSDTIASGLSPGLHTLTFSDVPGYDTPAPQVVTIASNTTTEATGTYVLQVGSLQVFIAPPEAISAGALWQVDGGPLHNSGDIVGGLVPGLHLVSFTDVSGYTTPASQTVTITNGGVTMTTGTYVIATGSLQVTITPPGAITAGAMWELNGGTPLASGTIVSGLSPGTYTVTFTDASGYTTPGSQTVTIVAGATTPATGVYVAVVSSGAIQVTLSPVGAVTAGAMWQLNGGTPQSTGTILGGLAPGTYTVSFTAVAGYVTPGNQSVTVTSGVTSLVTGVYTPVVSAGSLKVTIVPAGAVAAGATWSVNGGSPQTSGTTLGLPPGTYSLSFSTIAGYTTPTTTTVTISSNALTTITGTYVMPGTSGSLMVTLNPVAAVLGGAKWQLNGGTLQASGTTLAGLAPGTYTVSFTTVSGYVTPSPRTVVIVANQTRIVSAVYAVNAPTSSVLVNLAPAGAISAGATWQLDGGLAQASGTTLTGVGVGPHTVSFTPAAGYTTPPSQTVTVSAGVTATATGTYAVNPTTFAIALASSPLSGGAVSGAGTFAINSTCTVTANPAGGYFFTNWTENGAVVSTSASYAFVLTANRNLVAHFVSVGAPVITSAAGTTFAAGELNTFNVTATGGPGLTFSATGALPDGVTLDAQSGLLSGTPMNLSGGTYVLGVQAANGFGTGAVQTFTLIVTPQVADFVAWQNAYGITTQPGDLLQPDGVPSLLKYFYDIDPTQPMTASDRAALPALGFDTTTQPGTTYLALTYRQYARLTGVTVVLQLSTDLVNWTTVAPDINAQTAVDPATGDPMIETGIEVPQPSNMFLRLQVTTP
jgi:probable HAF family extracellular repeat protein